MEPLRRDLVADQTPEVSWPNGARCAVMLSFDLDGPAVWIDEDPRTLERPALFSLGAYGPHRGVANLLALLQDHGVRATFFVPAWVAEHWPGRVAEIVAAGHEIGHHGYLHELYFERSAAEQEELIEKCQGIFERLLGSRAVGYRTPSGDFRPESPALLERLGFSYSSSMRGDDRPYFWQIDGRLSALVEIPAKWELDDFPQFGYHDDPPTPASQDRIGSLEATYDNWRREFDGYCRFGLCYVLMCHPQLMGRPARVRLLGRLLEHIQAHDVWFATGAEIAEWWRKRQA
jgi:peptidoglycan/xylan/chitin deacetylase (PgdA/CDA1 family)